VLLLLATAPTTLPYALLVAAGPLLSIPLAVVTALPAVGRAMVLIGLGRLPEETATPAELEALKLPAIEVRRAARAQGAAAASPRWNERWRRLRGVLRSLRIYYGDRKRRAAMETLYGHFVRPGDLVLDVGAHVGDRVAVFRRLGARVVAVEPQPALVRTLKLLYGRDHAVQIEPLAGGAKTPGLDLRVNAANPHALTA